MMKLDFVTLILINLIIHGLSKLLTYCPIHTGCECYVVSIDLEHAGVHSNIAERCHTLGFILIEEPDHIRFRDRSTLSLKQFLASGFTSHEDTDDVKVVICSANMEQYSQRVYKGFGDYNDPPCDGLTIYSRTKVNRCLPACQLNKVALEREELSKKLLDIWKGMTPNPLDVVHECDGDMEYTTPCCRFPALPDTHSFIWDYDSDEIISVNIFCADLHQRSVRDGVVIQCFNSGVKYLSDVYPRENCTYNNCVLNTDYSWTSYVGTLVGNTGYLTYPGGISMSHSSEGPTLLVTCVKDPQESLREYQLVPCVYNESIAEWDWELSSLNPCFQGHQMAISRPINDYIRTHRLSNGECFIITYDTVYKPIPACKFAGGGVYKVQMPRMDADPLRDMIGDNRYLFWVPHSFTAQDSNNQPYIQWLDETPFNWEYTNTDEATYFAPKPAGYMGEDDCFVYDTDQPEHYVQTSCDNMMHELCYLHDVSHIARGEWAEWSNWTVCVNHTKIRYRLCTTDNLFCSGCNGDQPQETEFCCYKSYALKHATVEFINDTKVTVTCDLGFRLPDGEIANTYRCENNSDWEAQYEPRCIPKQCGDPGVTHPTTDLILGAEAPFGVGDTLLFRCKSLLIIENTDNITSREIRCLPSQKWTGAPPVCVGKQLNYRKLAFLTSHLNITATTVEYTASEHSVAGRLREEDMVYSGDTLHVTCDVGFEFVFNLSTITLVAGINGFIGFLPCQELLCEPGPTPPANSHTVSGMAARYVGSSITYRCLPGFLDRHSRKDKLTIKCLANRTWSPSEMLECEKAACAKPPTVANGRLRGLSQSGLYKVHDAVVVTCDEGYGIKQVTGLYKNSAYSRCEDSHGEWSHHHMTQCTKIECPIFKQLRNAHILNAAKHYYHGDNITVACYPKHVFIGTEMISGEGQSEAMKTCLADGTWDGPDDVDCYTHQLQFGPTVTVYPNQPGKITLTWLNTYLFRYKDNILTRETTPSERADDDRMAIYMIYLKGKDKQEVLRVNISYQFEAPRVNRSHSTELKVPAGFYYDLWIETEVPEWSELATEQPQVKFYSPTGVPALAYGYTLEDMAPRMQNSSRIQDFLIGESIIDVELADVFSPINGSVHLFNLIVVERNEFLSDAYLAGKMESNLTTWARAKEFPYWPPYLITSKCNLFTGAGCPDLASHLHVGKRGFSAKDPLFKGGDAFSGSVDGTGFEDVAITNQNLLEWTRLKKEIEPARITQYTVGGEPNCDESKKDIYCNGKLKLVADYCIKLRAYTNDHYLDSPCASIVDDQGALNVQWIKASIAPFGFAVIPFCILAAAVLLAMMKADFSDGLDDPQIAALQEEKRKERTKIKWKTLIFRAYDVALTTDNTEELNLLTVDSGYKLGRSINHPKLNNVNELQKVRLHRRGSFATANKEWIEGRLREAYDIGVSNTSLNIHMEDDEIYDESNLLLEQHLPYEFFQDGQLIKPFQIRPKEKKSQMMNTDMMKPE